jgi:hypothetical protein
MTTFQRLLNINAAPMKIGVVKAQRDDGRYELDIDGRTRIVRSTQGALSPGRRVAVSKINGRWIVTDDLKNFEASRTVTVIINA